MLTELRGLICNEEEKKICCDICDGIEQGHSSSPCYIPNIENGECGLMEGGAAKRQRNGRIVGEQKIFFNSKLFKMYRLFKVEITPSWENFPG